MTIETLKTAVPYDHSDASKDQASEPEASPAKGDEDILDDPSRRAFVRSRDNSRQLSQGG